MRQEQPKTARLARHGTTEGGRKPAGSPKSPPIFRGGAGHAMIAPNFGVTWGLPGEAITWRIRWTRPSHPLPAQTR